MLFNDRIGKTNKRNMSNLNPAPLTHPKWALHWTAMLFLVFLNLNWTHTQKNLQNLQPQVEKWCREVTQAPQGLHRGWGTARAWATPGQAGILRWPYLTPGLWSSRRDAELGQVSSLLARALGACVFFTLFPGALGLGRSRPPQPLTTDSD